MDSNYLVRVAFREGGREFYAEADAGVVVVDGPQRGQIDLRLGNGHTDTFWYRYSERVAIGKPVAVCAPRSSTMNPRLALCGAFWRIVPAEQVKA